MISLQNRSTHTLERGNSMETQATATTETTASVPATNFVAILSTTILTVGDFRVEQIAFPESLAGIPHYVGHPETKALIEELGAQQAPEKLFTGLQVGETYLAVPLANNKREAGWTVHQAVAGVHELRAMRVTRIS